MNQNGADLPHKHYVIAPQNQSDLNSYINQNLSSGSSSFYRFQPISTHLRGHLLDPLTGAIMQLTKPPECHASNPESNAKLQFLKESLVAIRPIMSSSTTHLLPPQVIEKPSSTGMGKEVLFAETDLNLTATASGHIERPVAKKPHNFLDGSNQFTAGCNEFSLSSVQSSGMIGGRANDESTSISALSNTTETDNEIIALKAQIDFLYSKLNEIQRKCNTMTQNLHENKGSMLKNINANVDSCGYLKIANERIKAVSCTASDNSQIYQFITSSDQNDESISKQPINEAIYSMDSAEEKKEEQLGRLSDTWKNDGQITTLKLTTSGICQKKTPAEMKADEGIIFVDCPQATINEELKSDDRKSINSHPDKSNSAIANERNSNSGTNENCESRSFDDGRLEQKKEKLREECSRSASDKLEKEDTMIGVKRKQEYWNLSHVKITKESVESKTQREKLTQSSKHCFPPPNHHHHFIQSSKSLIGFQQPTIALQQPPVRFGPMLCLSNISTTAENHSYFAHSYNPFLQSEPIQFLTSNQRPNQFIPTMTTPMQAFQQYQNPLLNAQFPTVGNAINATATRPTTNSLSYNSHMTKRKLLLKNRMMSSAMKKKLMNSKARNAQVIPPINNIINLPNAIGFDHLTKGQTITRVKNPLYPSQLSACQQIMDMKEQSIPMGNVGTLPRNTELQQLPSNCNVLTMPQPTAMNSYNCFL
ncbi:unnamed protein product [Litomosoides sigmodontis]|uniref:Uncharacterized protein n=1 Tax=Litomosoides sigmodontis TaxID=42156 RepID=A0A3P6SS90_LITSI|nr:unnamed protein product [Litomosoides sigmodontis]